MFTINMRPLYVGICLRMKGFLVANVLWMWFRTDSEALMYLISSETVTPPISIFTLFQGIT